jgi:hypothetical protein
LGLQAVLSIVRRALQELPMVPRDVELRYHINITTGDSLAISVFVGNDQFYQVKASEFIDLRGLYELHCRAWQDHPAIVPRPLGHRVDGGWSIMVTDGVHHRVLHRSAVLGSRWRRRGTMSSQLCMYFQRKGTHGGPHDEAEQARLVQRVAAHFEGGPYARIATACIRQAQASGVESMPTQAQHGDFVLNNLGQHDGRLVVFDWEDYGRVGLPGFDICTLCLSLLGEDADALRRVMSARAPQAQVLDDVLARACQAQGIELDRFRRLIPFYLLVFLYLKRNYGTAVQDRIGRLLTGLVPRSEHSAESLVAEPAVSPH